LKYCLEITGHHDHRAVPQGRHHTFNYFSLRSSVDVRGFMQNNVQQCGMDFDMAVVIDQPQFSELVHKKFTRERVVPIISASVSWLTFGMIVSGRPSLPKFAGNRRARANRFSLELNS
jgi:hypothetical protein